MTANNSQIKTLHNLLDYDVNKFVSAEIQLKSSLPGWIERVSSLKLSIVLQKYLDFVQAHIQKMEDYLQEEKIGSLGFTNRVMQAFVEETDEILSHCTNAVVIDAALLACIQNINHVKISMYGTAAAFANTLGMEKQACVFHELEVNEKQIDDRLTQLAEFEVNTKAKTTIVLPK